MTTSKTKIRAREAAYGSRCILFADGLARAERLVREITRREFAGQPFYVVPLQKCSWACGVADLSNGEAWRPEIGDRWEGRGPTAIIFRESILERARQRQRSVGLSDSGFAHYRLMVLYAVAIHEAAHLVLPMVTRRPTLHRTSEDDIQLAAQLRSITLSVVAKPSLPPVELDPWIGHDLTFLRCTLHLLQRARMLGANVQSTETYRGTNYGVSSASQYEIALEQELRDRSDESLIDILRDPAPEEFEQLWTNDVARYRLQMAADRRTT